MSEVLQKVGYKLQGQEAKQKERAINLHIHLLMRIQLELGKICKETSDALTPEELIADINRWYSEIPKISTNE